jgi:hypothetical protein
MRVRREYQQAGLAGFRSQASHRSRESRVQCTGGLIAFFGAGGGRFWEASSGLGIFVDRGRGAGEVVGSYGEELL